MTYNEYVEKRNRLMNEARTAFADGNKEKANELKDQIPALDKEWEEQAQFEANMNALEGTQKKVNIQNLGGVQTPASNTVDAIENEKQEDLFKTDLYLNAWAKTMQNKTLTTDEAKVFEMVNDAAAPYTHTTGNSGVLIPENVSAGIWREIAEKFPFYADTMKTYIKGKAIMIVAKSSTEAKWYVESVKTEDGKEMFDRITLNGCELSRAITVSWKLNEMAVADFIPYIISSMAEQMGKGLAYGVMNGAGVTAESQNAPEPIGLITALKAEENTPQVVEYEGHITYATLIAGRAKVKSGYTPKVYVTANTMWTELAAMVDGNGRPLLMADATAGGAYRILGCVVEEDDSVGDGNVVFSDAKQYQVNINKEISMTTEDHNKDRVTDYCAYAIVDGAPLTTKAHSLITKKA